MEPEVALPPKLERVLERIRAAGIGVHLIGGALRDILLGREARDFDLVVAGELAAAQRVLPAARSIAARIPLLLLSEDASGPRIEITSLRKGAEGIEGDLRRRDFTLNAIAFDPGRGVIVDPLGGRRHLERRELHAVDPPRGFREDAARILRGVRLAAELTLSIPPQTRRAMQLEAWRIHDVSAERRRDELFRLLRLPRVSAAFAVLREMGALAALLPELLRTVGVGQNRHHTEDLHRHTLRVCDALPPEPLLRLAALLHDVAKPETKRWSARTRDFSFLRHDLAGTRWTERVARRLRLSGAERDRLARLVRHHLLFPERLQTRPALRRLLRRVGPDLLPDLLALRRADLASREPTGHPPPEWIATEQRILATSQARATVASVPLEIGGRDVMRELGVAEGEEVGRWLRRLRRHILEHPQENERERLLIWLRDSSES